MYFQGRFFKYIAPIGFKSLLYHLMTHKAYIQIPLCSKHRFCRLKVIVCHFKPVINFIIHHKYINSVCKFSERYAQNPSIFQLSHEKSSRFSAALGNSSKLDCARLHKNSHQCFLLPPHHHKAVCLNAGFEEIGEAGLLVGGQGFCFFLHAHQSHNETL